MTPAEAASIKNEPTVRLRVSVHDALAAQRGAHNIKDQAALHGIHRSTMFRLRSGERVASLELALKMATDLGVPVEVLFERTKLVAG